MRISDWSSDVCASDLVAWGRARSDGVNRRHLWHIMFEQGFDAVLQRRGRRRTARAGALHLEIDIALVEAAIEDVAAVARDSGADARFDQFPDLRDAVGVGGIVRSEEHTSELQSL